MNIKSGNIFIVILISVSFLISIGTGYYLSTRKASYQTKIEPINSNSSKFQSYPTPLTTNIATKQKPDEAEIILNNLPISQIVKDCSDFVPSKMEISPTNNHNADKRYYFVRFSGDTPSVFVEMTNSGDIWGLGRKWCLGKTTSQNEPWLEFKNNIAGLSFKYPFGYSIKESPPQNEAIYQGWILSDWERFCVEEKTNPCGLTDQPLGILYVEVYKTNGAIDLLEWANKKWPVYYLDQSKPGFLDPKQVTFPGLGTGIYGREDCTFLCVYHWIFQNQSRNLIYDFSKGTTGNLSDIEKPILEILNSAKTQ